MKSLPSIQEMQPGERADWLRNAWGVEVLYSCTEECCYPMDIFERGQRIGRIVRSGNLVVFNLPDVDCLESDRACRLDALELWDFLNPQNLLEGDAATERINDLIHYFIGKWASQQGSGRTYG